MDSNDKPVPGIKVGTNSDVQDTIRSSDGTPVHDSDNGHDGLNKEDLFTAMSMTPEKFKEHKIGEAMHGVMKAIDADDTEEEQAKAAMHLLKQYFRNVTW